MDSNIYLTFSYVSDCILGENINCYISACANTDASSTSQFTVGLCRQLCCKPSAAALPACHVSVLQISDTYASSSQMINIQLIST